MYRFYFDPVVILLGQHRPDQPDNRITVGKDPHDVGAPANLTIEPFGGVVGPHLRPHGFDARW